MKKDNIDQLFEDLEGCFDVHESPNGHQKRFLNKLNNTTETTSNKSSFWKSLSIAASIAVLIAVGSLFLKSDVSHAELASVSPK